MTLKKTLIALSLIILLAEFPAQVDIDIALVEFASGFDKPVDITTAGDARLFILEKDGVIRILNSDGTINAQPFLDIQSQTSTGGLNSEQGLLGIAFHPDYESNGFFYLNYTRGNGDTRISRFTVSGDEDIADATSRVDILDIDQPYGNHNGGGLKFGPDGYLYIGMGDGGSAEDPLDAGQSMNTLLGKMLRIDVDGASPYGIPADNPFVGTSADTLPEIWASGLRNPWRYSFDRITGDLWMGDVGQYNWEEIDWQPASSMGGENYGWRCYEGNHSGFGGGCPPMSAFTGPVAEYSHSGGNCSVTGGFVYRGNSFGELQGKYIYVDYCSGQFWSLEQNDADEWVVFTISGQEGFGWTAFGEDQFGELYVAKQTDGTIHRIVQDGCENNFAEIGGDGFGNLVASDGIAWQWYLNGEAIPLATDQTYTPVVEGQYTVLVSFDSSCAMYAATFDYSFTSIDELSNAHGVTLIQNPIGEELLLQFAQSVQASIDLQCFDAVGKMVFMDRIQPGIQYWSHTSSGLESGNYTLSLSNEKGVTAVRFTVVD
ncbi:MAG: hypothetical protein HKN79_00675 [Flavobacteriales bacterium]|nr:hypothetical protein [Flavobacteriales bacterium]